MEILLPIYCIAGTVLMKLAGRAVYGETRFANAEIDCVTLTIRNIAGPHGKQRKKQGSASRTIRQVNREMQHTATQSVLEARRSDSRKQ